MIAFKLNNLLLILKNVLININLSDVEDSTSDLIDLS